MLASYLFAFVNHLVGDQVGHYEKSVVLVKLPLLFVQPLEGTV